jgi:hypothetical protein
MHSELCEEKKPVNVYKLGELNDRDHQFSLNLMTLTFHQEVLRKMIRSLALRQAAR